MMRARDLGAITGGRPGRHNAITDVPGVRVGHTTVVEPPDIHTGVTAVVPAGTPLPAGLFVGNGHGKLIGATQVAELGVIESPIVLTATLSAFRAADAPLDARQLTRVARRLVYGMARVGATYSHGSGDYGIAFSTVTGELPPPDADLSPLFAATLEATEEAILNSLAAAETTTGHRGRTLAAIPPEKLRALVGART